MHDHALAGHGGVNTTVERVARSFWWPRMRPSIEEYVLSCPDCQQQKPRNTLKPGFLHSLPIPDRTWTDISMDFIVGLPLVRGHDSIYVVVDRLSKYAHFIPCSSTVTAEGVAQLFINNVWKLYGFPKSIITDRHPKFVSAFWRSLMQRLGIENNMTTANHPEANGQTERTNRTLVQYLRLDTQQNTSNWLDILACAGWVYNTTVHSSTRCSPASLAYTETPLADPPLDLAVRSQPRPTVASDFGIELAAARECMRKAQERQPRNYDKRRSAVSFNPGELVLVDSHALCSMS
ncbi:Retrotransposon nucleocapsid protein, related [Eimeria mitis]|uniref:Retrotransposon nucleocapsid protein, related n=1 Tax=Eimeria mitis TaxID=44415 RepID=U6JRV0_9EIME|nr:Retrotransposon nucleocapsid protein, related [Eimeria mitis]CDJ28185.1 Retrotransposon nucleocapsid protein, related [Eimeria mitis]